MTGSRTIVFLMLALFCGSAGAQKPLVFDEREWGKDQHVREMLEYWRSWETSGPEKNIETARARGLKQFLAMPRPKRFGQYAQNGIPAWEQMATSQSSYVSGRTNDIAFDPTRPDDIMYLATSGGGLWKTTDGGEHWVAVSNSFNSYAVGGVVVDPTNGQIVYAATGDMYDRTGDGVYRSTDGGMNWQHIASSDWTAGIGDRTYQLLINPQNPRTLYHTNYGVRISHDGGATWELKKDLGGTTSLVIDPTDTNKLYAAGGPYAAGSIVRSTDGGNTWSEADLADNIPGKGTITLGMSPKDSSKIYASIGHPWGGTIGIARSTDFGQTWTLRSTETSNYLGSQSWYCNACTVSPTNANLVIVGGLDVWLSGQGGTSLVQKSDWTAEPFNSNFCHADIHALKFGPKGAGGGYKLYAMTDGGIFQSTSNGNSWRQSMNADLGTLLFVGADAAPDMSYIIGGCQDNGVNRAAAGVTRFQECDGGDGGRTFVAQSDPSVVFSTFYGVSLKRSMDSGRAGSFKNLIDDESPLRTEGTPFYMMYDVCETDASYVAVCGNQHVYYSESGAVSLNKISKIVLRPTAVHVCGADPYYLYVGTPESNGHVYITADAGANWVRSTTNIGQAAGFVSDPADKLKAFAITSGYGAKQFWKTEDGGKTWISPATNLPDLNMQTIARAPNGDLFIGHSYGVLRSIDGGVTWEPLRDGLPLCDVKKLNVRGDKHQWLIAATYGRSIYKINIADLPRESKTVTSAEDPNFRIASISPNPVRSEVELRYRVPSDCKSIVTLYDDLGREVRVLANEFTIAGDHILHATLTSLPSGTYSVVLAAGGKAITERLVITK